MSHGSPRALVRTEALLMKPTGVYGMLIARPNTLPPARRASWRGFEHVGNFLKGKTWAGCMVHGAWCMAHGLWCILTLEFVVS
jgi:hypothetical protein